MSVTTHMNRKESGFTLIELSIVLVIIGLIVGGVLVGQDLIKAAEVRATVGQVEKYSSAVNTFRSKYNGIPGDMTSGAATQFGMAARNGAAGRGDGNGLLEGGVATSTMICGETVLFWTDLTFAGLVDGNFVGTDGTTTGSACQDAASVALVATRVPPAKLGKGNFITTYNDAGYNFFQVFGGVTAIATTGAPTGAAVALSPNQAFQMDTKVDDAYPTSGAVQARNVTFANNAVPGAATSGAGGGTGICVNSTPSPNPYNTSASTGGETNSCSLRFRFM